MHIRVTELSKVYNNGTRALNGINLDVTPGEGVVILGPNGCGKSTLLKCLIGLERPSAGQIFLGSTEIHSARPVALRTMRRHLGCVFQKIHLVGNVSVLQNVLYGLLGQQGLFGSWALTAGSEARNQAMEALDRVELSHLAGRRADTLSCGQQQRVAIARMLMQNAQVVLADEPVASLDPKAGREVMDLLWAIVKERGMTVICVMHQLALAQEYGERLVGLRDGRLIFDHLTAEIDQHTLNNLYESEPSHDG